MATEALGRKVEYILQGNAVQCVENCGVLPLYNIPYCIIFGGREEPL